MGLRAGLDAVDQRIILPLMGTEPGPTLNLISEKQHVYVEEIETFHGKFRLLDSVKTKMNIQAVKCS
jgi:hypothetical protein